MRHAVAFAIEGGVPTLWCADGGDGAPRAMPLRGGFSWHLSEGRTCIGSWNGDAHAPCPDAAEVTHEPACAACAGPPPPCLFEPLCQRDGVACSCAFGQAPHAVYVAFHGPLAKVGMTRQARLERRIREQGADAYFVAAVAPSRGAARNAERSLSLLFGVPEWRAARETLPPLARPVAHAVIEERAQRLQSRMAGRFEAGPLRFVEHALAQPLPAVPARVRADGRHAGTWLGAKGQHLFYLAAPHPGRLPGPAVVALRIGDLLGRALKVEG